MKNNSMVISYAFAAIAGVCFIQGLAILSKGRVMIKHGQHTKNRVYNRWSIRHR